jgi:hypothetical protein
MSINTAPLGALAVGLVALLGCSACANLHGAWYYQPEKNNEQERLYLTIVNSGKDVLYLRHVSVNSSSKTAKDGDWECCGAQDAKRGEIILLPLPMTGLARCSVPVTVDLQLDDNSVVHKDLPSAMPSALPSAWRFCSNALPTKPSAEKAPGADLATESSKDLDASSRNKGWTCHVRSSVDKPTTLAVKILRAKP